MYYISRFTRLYAIFTVFDNLYYYISHLSCYDIILFLQAKRKLSHDPIGERRKVVGIAAHKATALLQLLRVSRISADNISIARKV